MVSLDIAVLDADGNAIEQYVPETTYDVKVTMNVEGGDPSAFGFQILALNAPLDVDGADVPTWSEPGSNVQIATADNGRTYAEQLGASSSNEFEMKWTAPAAGAGAVTFYSCGNGVNGNATSNGDGAACNTLELTEDVGSNTDQVLVESLNVQIAPNPVQDILNLQIDSEVSEVMEIQLLDMTGKSLGTQSVQLTQGMNQASFDASALNSGFLFSANQSRSGQ